MVDLKKLNDLGSLGESSVVSIGNLVGSVISAVFWLTLASTISVSSYGEVNYHIAIATMFASLSLLGLDIASVTYLARGKEDVFKQSIVLVLTISSISSIIVGIIVNNLLLTVLLLVGNNLLALTLSESLGKKRYKLYTLYMLLNKSSQFILALSFYHIMGVEGVLLGYALPPIILGAKILLRLQFSIDVIRTKFNFLVHAYSLTISQSVLMFGDKIIIGPLFGFEALGLYQLAFQFLIFLSVIPTSLYQYLLPQEASGNDRRQIRKLGLIASVVIAIAFYFSVSYVINWLFPQYISAIPAAQIMGFGIIPLTITSIINARLLGNGNSKPVLFASLVYIGSLISLLYILGPQGLMGFAQAVLVSLSINTITLWLFVKKI